MTREEAIKTVKEHCYFASLVPAAREALDLMIKTVEDFEALNAINLDLADENEDLVERIGKLIGYIDFLRNTAQGKKKSLNLLEKVVKGELEEIRAEGENFVKPRTGEWIPVSEKLPEANRAVLTYIDTGATKTYCLAYWNDAREAWEEWIVYDLIEKDRYYKVIAWMPLPEPYKAESEANNG